MRSKPTSPLWKYVSVRRHFAYIAHSLNAGTRWAVFEPNGTLRP